MLALKAISPTRLVKNALYDRIAEAERGGADADSLRQILGQAATKRGIFEGDTDNGELEIGQIASAIKTVEPVSVVMSRLIREYTETMAQLSHCAAKNS